jgi:hypothetical protein
MERNILMVAARCAAALALLFLAGCAPTIAGGPAAAPDTTTVQPVGAPVPAPTRAPTEAISSTVMPTAGQTSQPGVIVGTSVPSTITLGSTVPPTATEASGALGPVGAPTAETPTVTQADQGKTITLHVGQRFLLSLGEGYDWNVIIDKQDVVSRVIGILTVRGSQGLFEAHQAGTGALTATGDPLCRQSQPPCGQPSILFNVKIVVQ